jgi:hypothetical protein
MEQQGIQEFYLDRIPSSWLQTDEERRKYQLGVKLVGGLIWVILGLIATLVSGSIWGLIAGAVAAVISALYCTSCWGRKATFLGITGVFSMLRPIACCYKKLAIGATDLFTIYCKNIFRKSKCRNLTKTNIMDVTVKEIPIFDKQKETQ